MTDPIHTRLEDGARGRIVAERDGEAIGELTFRREAGTLTVVHTEVLPSGRGGGVGKTLVHAAVDLARREHLQVIPLCPYAKTVFDREPGLRDVLAQGH